MADVAAAPHRVDVRVPALLGGRIGEVDLLQVRLAEAAEVALERVDQVELGGDRQAEVRVLHASERLRVVLGDGGVEEVVQGTAVAGPARPVEGRGRRVDVTGVGRDAGAHRQHVRHAADRELVGRIRERGARVVDVLQDSAQQQRRLSLELREGRVGLEDEQRITRRERADERPVNRVVVLRPMAGAAGPPVAVEGLAQEDVGAHADVLAHQPGQDARVLGAGGLPLLNLLVRRQRADPDVERRRPGLRSSWVGARCDHRRGDGNAHNRYQAHSRTRHGTSIPSACFEFRELVFFGARQ